MRRFFGVTHVNQKLILSSFATSVLPLLLIFAVALPMYRSSRYRETSASYLAAVERCAAQVEGVAEQIVVYSSIYFTNTDLNRILRRPAPASAYEQLERARTMSAIFADNTYIFGEMRYYAGITALNGLSYSSSPDAFVPSIQALQQEPWYGDLERGGGRIEWVRNADGRLSPYPHDLSSFAAVRPIMHPYSGKVLGVLLIIPHERVLSRLIQGALAQFDQFFILDGDGALIAGSGGELPDEQALRKIGGNLKGYFQSHVGGVDSLAAFAKISPMGWKAVGMVGNGELYAPINSLILGAAGVLILLLCSIIAFAVVLNRRISKPISQLDREMQAVSLDNLDVRSLVDSDDEIGNLARSFSGMVRRMKALLEEREQAQRRKRRAEIRALQAQIQPHFLYNTLASIRFMLFTRPNSETDQVIGSLVKLLKSTITSKDEYHTLREELALLSDYALIMRARDGGKFEMICDVPEPPMDMLVIKLMLQPIVENAIFHGFHHMHSGGLIRISAHTEDGCLLIEVRDNGPGMGEGQIAEVLGAAGDAHHGGVRNVHDRIAAHFGAPYGLSMQSGPDGGLVTRIRLPIMVKRGESRP